MNISKYIGILIVLVYSLSILSSTAIAEDKEVVIKGIVKSIDLEMKTLIVKTYEGKLVSITIDDTALNKFEKKVIREDDDVTVKCIVQNNKLKSVSFFKKNLADNYINVRDTLSGVNILIFRQ